MLAYSHTPGMFNGPGRRMTRTAPDGTFQFTDVAGGHYMLMAAAADQQITVADSNLDDLVLVSRTGSTVSGNVVTEDGSAPPFEPSGVRVVLDAPYPNVLPTMRVVSVDASWSFKLTQLGGSFLFRLIGIPNGWMLGSVTLGEKDITDVPWDVPTSGRQLAGLTLVVTQKIGTATGSVVDANGKPTADAVVVVFADDPDLWIPGSRRIRTARPDSTGRFSLKGLPAGTYCAVARAFLEEGQWEAPDFLEQARAGATTFTIDDGGSASVSLSVRR
ncbi:MAG: carboxypeptidase-like regulatory domain-containing protein [Acidobacteriota bacterium]